MADVIPVGVTSTASRQDLLRAGDNLVNASLGMLAVTGLVGFTGVQGATGLQNITQGNTGIGLRGHTGLAGVTGFSARGDTGLQALTGIAGATGISISGTTGLSGETGVEGITGLIGVRGTTGLRGYTGLGGIAGMPGVTGLIGSTGSSLSGITGLRGETGVLGHTGLQGSTGVGLRGFTGLRGDTGIQGFTGMLDLRTVSVQTQTSGITLLYAIPPNSFAMVGQQLEITAWGISATDGAVTTVTIVYAGNQIFQDTIAFASGSDILLEGYILLWGAVAYDTSIRGIYGSNEGTTSYVQNILISPSVTQNLYVSLSSAGTGHTLYGLLVRSQQPGLNNGI